MITLTIREQARLVTFSVLNLRHFLRSSLLTSNVHLAIFLFEALPLLNFVLHSWPMC